jgi:fluoride exporter
VTLVLVLLGGAVGALLRHVTAVVVRPRPRTAFPVGTFLVNVTGSTVLGLLTGAATALPPHVGTLVGTGFCGALTTYSTFGNETLHLWQHGRRRIAVAYVTASVLAGLAGAFLGAAVA